MYVVPDSTIILLKGCPLNKNYEHTIYFDSVAEQTAYFMGLAKRTFDKCTYQRELRGRCSLQVNTADIYDCNYMMYQNSAYNNKWFYAFIDRVEWVNNANTNVYFTIDVMQTWFFDYDLQMCFVEREHVATDELFEHTIPEELGYGELICSAIELDDHPSFNPDCFILLASETPSGQRPDSRKLYGQWCPLYAIITIPPTGSQGGWNDLRVPVQQYLESGRGDAVISIYPIPEFMGATLDGQYPEEIAFTNISTKKKTDNIDGYVPRNKKLFCYPYNVLWITNNNGSVSEYRYEDFQYNSDKYDTCVFAVYGTALTTPSMTIVPVDYKGFSQSFDESLTLSAYPPVPFIGDIYAAYMAQNENKMAYAQTVPVSRGMFNAGMSLINGAVNGLFGGGKAALMAPRGAHVEGGAQNPYAVGAYSGSDSFVGGLMGAINSLIEGNYNKQVVEANQLATLEDVQNIPNTARNLSTASSVLMGTDKLRPLIYKMTIKREYAEIIDSYFDKYGYKCNETKTPNRNVRPHWTYTKTVGCTINARCPSDDEETICQIYNRGITFWRNGSEVGDYSLDNTV